MGVGEGALHVTEQFALQKSIRDRTAIDRDEGSRGPRAIIMVALAISSLPVPLSPWIKTVRTSTEGTGLARCAAQNQRRRLT